MTLQASCCTPQPPHPVPVRPGFPSPPSPLAQEAFHVRRKDFWPLTKAHKLIHDFIPNLCHEADGLIFQGAQARVCVCMCGGDRGGCVWCWCW